MDVRPIPRWSWATTSKFAVNSEMSGPLVGAWSPSRCRTTTSAPRRFARSRCRCRSWSQWAWPDGTRLQTRRNRATAIGANTATSATHHSSDWHDVVRGAVAEHRLRRRRRGQRAHGVDHRGDRLVLGERLAASPASSSPARRRSTRTSAGTRAATCPGRPARCRRTGRCVMNTHDEGEAEQDAQAEGGERRPRRAVEPEPDREADRRS